MIGSFEDLRQSDEWAEYLSHLGWLAVRSKITPKQSKLATGQEYQRSNIFIRKIPLIGSVVKIQRPREIPPIEEIDKIAKEHRALFVKLEPSLQPQNQTPPASVRGKQFSNLTLQQFSPDTWPLAPTRTIHVDLTPSEEEIFANFSKDGRYSIRKAQKLGVVVVCKARPCGKSNGPQQLKEFYELLRETGKRKRFWVAPFKDLKAKAEAFKDKSTLILAYHNSELVAGALILFHDNLAYYHHAASNLQGRKFLAPYPVVWEAIKLAKKRGCRTLDLEGIYDPRYKIYRRFRKIGIFKKKFGGKEVEYPGSFIRYYNPIAKLVFKLTSWG